MEKLIFNQSLLFLENLQNLVPNRMRYLDVHIYKYITKGNVSLQIKGDALRRLKPECEDYLVIDDVLLRIKIPKVKNIKPSLPLVIPKTYIPIILYQYHGSFLAGHQGITRMYLTLKKKFYTNVIPI